ncbi:uncharacterized protein LOC132799576 [Ziziphus jujuba]|uniref:Uncharacterized protein LOC132799576 n=1 Tax=Ziziphus jujuba TaxID=326968 RepID=A0ABM3ZTG9_ZIZJJ|nr:uncharacterized protein LOC132799576 [Ziziphus jujuba]
MKIVSANTISTKPISLSKATATLSMFVSTDTGASQAIGAYLGQTLSSFKELKQLKTPRSEKKGKRHASDIVNNGEMTAGENPTQSVEAIQELRQGSAPIRKKKKQKRHTSDIVNNGEMTTGENPTPSVEQLKN